MTYYIDPPKGRRNREALILAHHGPLAAVKGTKAQQKSLVKNGYLTPELELTSVGAQAYDWMSKAHEWSKLRQIAPWFRSSGWAPSGTTWLPSCVAQLSTDGLTLYVAERKIGGEAIADNARTVPNDVYEQLLGHKRIGVA